MTVRESIDEVLAKAPSRAGGIAHSSITEFATHCPKARIVFEIGAYNGFDIPDIHRHWPEAIIHCFEPDPDNFARLVEFRSEFIPCHQVALSSQEGTLPFYRALDSRTEDQSNREEWFKTAGSLRHQGPTHLGTRPELREERIDVQCTTVDHYCQEHGVVPDLILMDTQGCEYEILEGAIGTLPLVKGVLLEWSIVSLYQDQKMLPDLQDLLAKFGFVMTKQINLWGNQHGDAIFTRS